MDKKKDAGVIIRKYDLSNKTDLLGAFGHVEPDTEDPTKEHIVSLGLIINDCPGRALLEYEREHMEKKGFLAYYEHEMELAATDETVARIILICVFSGTVLMLCYLCLKNRGKICKCKRGNDDVKNELELEPSGQDDPAPDV